MPKRILATVLSAAVLCALSATAHAQEEMPVLAAIGNKTTNENVPLTFTATASDPTGSPLVFTLGPGAPAGATIGLSSGAFGWTPSEAQGPGITPITVIVTRTSDGASDQETIAVTVNEVNVPPVLVPIGNKVANANILLTFTATATDPDIPANALAFSLDPGAPTGASIGLSSGVFTWTPTFSQAGAAYPITIRVTDNGAVPLSDFETISVTVGQIFCTPVLSAIGDKTVNEMSLLTFTVTATVACDPPPTLTFSLGAGAPAGAMIDPATGAFSWAPAECQGPGVYPITICVANDAVPPFLDCETFQVTVAEVNSPPIISQIGNQVVTEGNLLTFSITGTDPDCPQQTLTCVPPPGSPPGVTIAPDCVFRWIPTECQGPGVYSITVCLMDNGTPPLTSCTTIVVTVLEDNLTPVLNPIGNKTVEEGSLLIFTATATDGDCPAQSLAFTLGPGAPLGATIQQSTGVFTWTPTAAQGPGVYPITVRVTDGSLIDSKTFEVTVTEGEASPLADAGGPYTGIRGVPVAFDGTGSADPNGDPLVYAWDFGDGVSGTGATPSHTYIAISPPGDYVVTLCVQDPGGLSDCDVTTARIVEFLSARVFTTGGNKTVRLGSGKPKTCVQVEPVVESFNVSDVDLTSLVMRFGGSAIPAIADKSAIVADTDHNGVDEIAACFSKEDLRVLFAGLPSGPNQVDVQIGGNLVGGGSFEGTATLSVVSSGGGLAASIAPNPLNPRASLTFETSEAGRVTVQLFDLRGRLVRTLMSASSTPAGYHDVAIDGLDERGLKLASGIYYVLVNTSTDGVARKAITILK